MQRRVAAIYLVFFVVMGASAYSVMAMAEQPAVDIPGQEYENGSTFTAGGTEYTVQVAMEEPSGEGGGGPVPVGSLTYQNGSETEEITLEEGANVTLADDTQYFAHFRTSGEDVSVVVAQTSEAYGAYQGDLARQDNFQQRMNGLWGVIILSVVVSLLVIPLAYMPVKG